MIEDLFTYKRPVMVSGRGYDKHGPGEWRARFHCFVDGMYAEEHSRQEAKPQAFAVVEREDGKVVMLPMSKYEIRFTDRDHEAT